MRHLVSTRFALMAMVAMFTFGILTCIAVDMAAGLHQPAYWHPVKPTVEVITEDDPRWDCATMGNRVCGPQFAKQS